MKKLFLTVTFVSLIAFGKFGFGQTSPEKSMDSLKVRIVDVKIDTGLYQPLLQKGESVTMRSGRIILKKGESIGEHPTDNYEEFLIVLVGQGVISGANGQRFPISEGQVVYIPPYSAHNIYNENSNKLIYIYVVAKAFDDK